MPQHSSQVLPRPANDNQASGVADDMEPWRRRLEECALPDFNIAEKSALGMLRRGLSFDEAAEANALSIARVKALWRREQRQGPSQTGDGPEEP